MLWAEPILPVHLPAHTQHNECGEKSASPALTSDLADNPRAARRALKRQFAVIALLLVCSVVSYSAINRWALSTVVVQGRSMAPTLQDGDRCLLNRLSYIYASPKRGDLVVLCDRSADDLAVKRIIALPGEKVRIEQGTIFVNGRRLVEAYLENGTRTAPPHGDEQFFTLSAHEYFVLGDNRAESEDSRYYGPVGREQIVGTLVK